MPEVMPGFVIIYIPSTAPTDIKETSEGLNLVGGKWQVDTDENGDIATYEELEEALDRVKKIREMGGEACLTTIIE